MFVSPCEAAMSELIFGLRLLVLVSGSAPWRLREMSLVAAALAPE